LEGYSETSRQDLCKGYEKHIKMKVPTLSIIILNYNTCDLLDNCLVSLEKVRKETSFEVIVVDNASTDDSVIYVEKKFKWVKVIRNSTNAGFAVGNNKAQGWCRGKYVLFLNSDTIVYQNTLKETVEYLDRHKDTGAVTCKLEMPDGTVDKDMRRSFPTPWVSFTHFSHLDRAFPRSKLFGRYWYGYLSADTEHEIDVAQGAFFLVRKNILDDVDWFDESYFLDGEDIDLSWKIRDKGWKIMYYPKVAILHIKGATKGKNKKYKEKVSFSKRKKFVTAGVDSMEIFYKKRLWNRYPYVLNIIVLMAIKAMKAYRIIKTLLS
jgi:GT2 family glycosyltransferase